MRAGRRIPLLCLAILCSSCDGNTVASDQAYADQLVTTELQPPLTFREVRKILARHDSDAVLQKGCGLIRRQPENCAYSSVALITLPRNNWWRGQGDLQVFMVFDEDEQLLSLDYDLAYPNSR